MSRVQDLKAAERLLASLGRPCSMESVYTLFPLCRNRMDEWNSYSLNQGTKLCLISGLLLLVENQHGIFFYSISSSVYSNSRSKK
jgi:hypothetical protein